MIKRTCTPQLTILREIILVGLNHFIGVFIHVVLRATIHLRQDSKILSAKYELGNPRHLEEVDVPVKMMYIDISLRERQGFIHFFNQFMRFI